MLSVIIWLFGCSNQNSQVKPMEGTAADTSEVEGETTDSTVELENTCPDPQVNECEDLVGLGCPYIQFEDGYEHHTRWGCQLNEVLGAGCAQLYGTYECPPFEVANSYAFDAESALVSEHCGLGTNFEFYWLHWTVLTDPEQDDRNPINYEAFFDIAGTLLTLTDDRDPHVRVDCCDGTLTTGSRWGSDTVYDTTTCTRL